MIKIDNLVKEYKMYARKKDRLMEAMFPNVVNKHGTFRAVNGLSIEIKKGEVLRNFRKKWCRKIHFAKNDNRCCYSNVW